MRKQQLKRELAKETRFRAAGQAPIEQGFHCQSKSNEAGRRPRPRIARSMSSADVLKC